MKLLKYINYLYQGRSQYTKYNAQTRNKLIIQIKTKPKNNQAEISTADKGNSIMN